MMVVYRRFRFLLVVLLTSLAAVAQGQSVRGRVVDSEDHQPLVKATLQLYRIGQGRGGRRDTTFVSGALSDGRGQFSFNTLRNGNYYLKTSYLGYKTKLSSFAVSGSAVNLSDIVLASEAVELREAVVTANLPKMVIKDDTVVYNADAFRVPEGSVIEALVEALPGAKIDDSGKISINGKDVKRFKLDGRDFMTGNNDAVMKNLPSYVVDKVKAYDEKSDQSRLTGIDDGNDDFVLEFTTKRSARNGIQANPDVGYGTDDRYGIRLTAMKPLGAMRYTFMGNANNVNDRNFSGRGGRGRGNGNGQRESKTAALDASYESGRKANGGSLRWNGRVTWNRQDADNWSRTGSENFVNTRGGAFSNSISQNYSRNNSWTGNMNLQWQLDSVTTLSLRPDLSISSNDGRGYSTNASFNADPYDYVNDPMSREGFSTMSALGLIVNDRQNKSMNYGTNANLRTNFQLHRRLNNKGRNVALTGSFSYRDGTSKNANLSGVHLYQQKDQYGNDSTYQTNRYTVSPSDNLGYSLGFTYTEPLFIIKTKPQPEDTLQTAQRGRGPFGNQNMRRLTGQQGLFLQLNYSYNYSYQKSDPSTYDLLDMSDELFQAALNDYRDFGFLPDDYEQYLSRALSRYSERTEYRHQTDVQLRLVRQKYNMNIGVQAQPERSHFVQQYLGQPVDTVRSVVNVSPTLNLRYRFNQQTNLQVNFRGQTQQPSITQLLEIYDDTNPLNISMGNAGLKPAFTTNLGVNFQKMRTPKLVEDSLGFMVPKNVRNWSFSTNASLQNTRNSIGNVVTYNETTGGRISRPENINGNWSVNGGGSFNIGLDTLNRWDFSGGISGSYRHQVGYVNQNHTAVPDRNVTHTYNLSPDVSLSYRNSGLNFSINFRANYAHTENELQASRNLSTWNYNYGGNCGVTFSWGTRLNTDFHCYSKRGYSDQTLNTDELIWNAQLSHSFLRGKKLTVMLQWYDILSQQTNFSRTVNANGWRDQETNAITSYAMLHVSYRMNFFGGRGGGWGGGERGEGRPDRGGNRGGRGGGFPGGGFPGGRRF